jgi:hypothetical protein
MRFEHPEEVARPRKDALKPTPQLGSPSGHADVDLTLR